MATNTTNYGWTKPSYEDSADVEVINGTIDDIDAQVKAIDDQVQLNKNNISNNRELQYNLSRNRAKTNNASDTLWIHLDIVPTTGKVALVIGSLISTDTDSSTCAVIFDYSDGTSSPIIQCNRGSNILKALDFEAKTAIKMTIYASNNYSHSIGDTVSVTNLMLSTKEDWDTDDTYQDYTYSNAELYAMIQAIQAQLAGS
jgi:hypothetical protein